jgi:hypothetical protein
MTLVETFNTSDYNQMAQTLGMTADSQKSSREGSNLARLRINHSAIMGEQEVNGKKVKLEVVSGGTYKLEIPDGPTYYSESVTIRPYMQRFMYKRFIKGNDTAPNRYVKTVMADNLNIDLKDNDGGFNCGKPAGWIEDFKALPQKTQDLIRQIKRVRVMFGTVSLDNPVDAEGNPVTQDLTDTPFIWEIENRDAFKMAGGIFTKLSKMRRLPPMHTIKSGTQERNLPNGSSFFLPELELDISSSLELDSQAQETLTNFLAWIANYNEYITNAWDENVHKHDDIPFADVDDIIDADIDEFA